MIIASMDSPLLQRQMDQTTLTRGGVQWMTSAYADELVAQFRASGRRLMAIDGFMGSGKSPLGSMIEARLGRQCTRIDRYFPPRPRKEQSAVERLNLGALRSDLDARLTAGEAVIEGGLMRDVLERLAVIPAADVFHVYVAGAWKPDEVRVAWPEAAQLDSVQSDALHIRFVDYHARARPHETFDAAVLRNLDEPDATGAFLAPDGQVFAVSEAAWPRAQMIRLRVNRWAFTCTEADAVLEPIGLVRPPVLSAATRSLDDARLHSVLRAIESNTPLPPVPVIREEGQALATLLDGAHRYFGSVATGMTFIPTLHVSMDDAEAGYQYKARGDDGSRAANHA
jgi:hypothetical protein